MAAETTGRIGAGVTNGTDWVTVVAVFSTGVVGVAGIVATFLAPDWAQRRIERRRLRGDFRAAQRLVSEELHIAGIHAKAIADHNYTFPPDWVNFLLTAEWDAHKNTLARTLKMDVYGVVRDAYTNVSQMRIALSFTAGVPLEEKHRALVRAVHRQAHEAGDALKAGSASLFQPMTEMVRGRS